MPATIISPLAHSPDEHVIVVRPGSESIQKITAIQQQLKAKLGDTIWLTPQHTLHVTLMEIICATQYKNLSRKQHFLNWYKQYNDVTREVIVHFPSIQATFNRLYVSRAAIILTAADPKPFNELRKRILAKTVLPPQTKQPPRIAHCTIARFNKAVDLTLIRAAARGITVDFGEHIHEFKLMKDLGPPFSPTLLETYKLNS